MWELNIVIIDLFVYPIEYCEYFQKRLTLIELKIGFAYEIKNNQSDETLFRNLQFNISLLAKYFRCFVYMFIHWALQLLRKAQIIFPYSRNKFEKLHGDRYC